MRSRQYWRKNNATITETTKLILFSLIFRSHFCIRDESLIYVITWWSALLMESLKVTGINLAIFAQLLLSTQLIMVSHLFISLMTPFKNTCHNMASTRKATKSVTTIFRNIWKSNMETNMTFILKFTLRWNELQLIRSVLVLFSLIHKRKVIILRFLAWTLWSTEIFILGWYKSTITLASSFHVPCWPKLFPQWWRMPLSTLIFNVEYA